METKESIKTIFFQWKFSNIRAKTCGWAVQQSYLQLIKDKPFLNFLLPKKLINHAAKFWEFRRKIINAQILRNFDFLKKTQMKN